MKTVKTAILYNSICAGACLLGALAIYVGFFHMLPQPYLNVPPEVHTKIQDIKDIEILRKAALMLESSRRSDIQSFNEIIELAVKLLAFLFIVACLIPLSNIKYWARHLREQRNEYVPWWLR